MLTTLLFFCKCLVYPEHFLSDSVTVVGIVQIGVKVYGHDKDKPAGEYRMCCNECKHIAVKSV